MPDYNPYRSPDADGQPPIAPPQVQFPAERLSASPLDAIIPTNPLAAIACYSGIFSVLFCVFGLLLGPLAIYTGRKALKQSQSNESAYGATTSTMRAWIGVVTGVLGTLLGIVVIVIFALGVWNA